MHDRVHPWARQKVTEESWGKVGGVCVWERERGTYASRVQQVSPSTSPPGALSVLTDSFSLAGMLTERQKGAEAEKKTADVERREEEETKREMN